MATLVGKHAEETRADWSLRRFNLIRISTLWPFYFWISSSVSIISISADQYSLTAVVDSDLRMSHSLNLCLPGSRLSFDNRLTDIWPGLPQTFSQNAKSIAQMHTDSRKSCHRNLVKVKRRPQSWFFFFLKKQDFREGFLTRSIHIWAIVGFLANKLKTD